jgi:hypothetical protein
MRGCIDTPRIIWRGSGLMEFIPVRDGHLYGRARINQVCWREFIKTIRHELPEDLALIRTSKGRKRITSSISYDGPVPKCTFFFDAITGERMELGSFIILRDTIDSERMELGSL